MNNYACERTAGPATVSTHASYSSSTISTLRGDSCDGVSKGESDFSYDAPTRERTLASNGLTSLYWRSEKN
jgi:hypothetical protein